MGIEKPYHLTVRPFSLYDFTSGRKSQYIRHNKYSSNAVNNGTVILSYLVGVIDSVIAAVNVHIIKNIKSNLIFIK